jgi:hypothetical protein
MTGKSFLNGLPKMTFNLDIATARKRTMDKKIKKGFEKVKKVASREEKLLVKEDIKRDKKCDQYEKKAKKKK